jgi:hypothetical protein
MSTAPAYEAICIAAPVVSAFMDGFPAEVTAAHDQAVAAGEPGYADPITGLFVFTAAYLTERRSCCDSGCRHCPYRGAAG